MSYPARARIVEVAPRDGLQNESSVVSPDIRIKLIEELVEAGVISIEVGSFVSPKWIPQMAATAEVLKKLHQKPGINYSALVPNLTGLDQALSCNVKEIAVFAAASESFSQRNINCSIDESFTRFAPVVERALAEGLRVRGYVSCVLDCPYEGKINPEAVSRVASKLFAMGCYEISLGDTIGTGTPLRARSLIEKIASELPLGRIALHFHDTYGQALANILACLDLGVSVIDSAIAGLGGCPYAKGATGNVATEDVVYMLEGMGIETGLDLARLCSAGAMISSELGRLTASRVAKARGN